MKYKNITYKTLTIAVVTLFVASCAVGPNFQKVEMESPETYLYQDTTIDASSELNWNELFDDEVLQVLIDSTLSNNHDLLIAVSSINESRAYLGMARADLYPKFSYGATSGLGNSLNPGGGSDINLTATANVNWELVFWGKYRRTNEAARAELAASEFGLKAIEISLIAQVSNAYHTLLDYNNRLIIAKRTLESRNESLRIISERFDKGVVPEIDLNQAEIQMATAAASVPVYERAIAITENAISVLIGENPRTIITNRNIESITLPEAIPAGLPSELLSSRPDILEAEQLVKAQNAYIGVAQAMRLPSISLTGLFGLTSLTLSNFNSIGNIGGDLFGPIFYFGKNKRRVDAEREKTEQLKLNYQKTVLSSFRETEDALVSIRTYKQELFFVEKQLLASRNAQVLSRQRYDGGVTSYLEVLESERTLFDIELYHSELLQKSLEAHINLYKTLGGNWVNDITTEE